MENNHFITGLVLHHEDHEAYKECKFMKNFLAFWKLRVLRGK